MAASSASADVVRVTVRLGRSCPTATSCALSPSRFGPTRRWRCARRSWARSRTFLRERLGQEVKLRKEREETQSLEAWERVTRADDLVRDGVDASLAGNEAESSRSLAPGRFTLRRGREAGSQVGDSDGRSRLGRTSIGVVFAGHDALQPDDAEGARHRRAGAGAIQGWGTGAGASRVRAGMAGNFPEHDGHRHAQASGRKPIFARPSMLDRMMPVAGTPWASCSTPMDASPSRPRRWRRRSTATPISSKSARW